MTLVLPAPAKLNLFLHILGRRSDGYHELQTLFQFLDWSDELHLSARQDGVLSLSPALPGVATEDNLIIRAARLLQKTTDCTLGADISLYKRLPMGGGIGGGSSDAATALVGLNQLWQLGLSEDRLAELGLSLGADVPVFVRGQAAFAEGVGERLQPAIPDENWYLLVVPEVSISTAAVFGHPELTRHTPAITMAHALTSGGHNDCENVVRKLYPELDQLFDRLAAFANPHLTGTGACIFCAFDDRSAAEQVRAQLPADWQVQICRGCNRSALHQALQQQITADEGL